MRATSMRFTGLASGLDTESIVKAMIAPNQSKVDYAKQDKLLMELKKETWKEMNGKIYDFYRKTLNDIKFSNSYGKSDVVVSNPNIIMVDKDSNMPEGNHTIKVDNVAKSATVSTSKIEADKTTKLKDLGFVKDEKITVTVNGNTRELEVTDETTIADVEKLLQSKKYEYIDKKDSEGNTVYEKDEDGKDTTTPVKVLVTELDTNINASFDTNLGAFIISTKNTGVSQSITFTVNGNGEEAQNKLAKLGMNLGETEDKDGKKSYGAIGENAKFLYNGIKGESESNKINVNGLQATLASKGETTVAVTKSVQSAIDFAMNFVEEYNKLIGEINTLVDAPSNSKYKPLTDEQRKGMSEGDIKLWDEKVKASVLRNDSTLKDLAAEMRRTIGDSDLFKFGISTGENWKEGGKLYIDEEKLKEMLTKDPHAFDAAFKDVGTKLYDGINKKLVKGTDAKSANFLFSDKILDKQIRSVGDKIFTLEERLIRQEDLYYKKFTAMEKMLSQLNNQGSWLSSQLGGM